MDGSVQGIAPVVALTTFYIAAAIIVAGVVSGLVTLGIAQAYARERIQRAVLYQFFEDPDLRHDRSSFWRRVRSLFARRGPEAQCAARLLDMPEPVLCRLYYRQISGQFLAAANAEAAGGRGGPDSGGAVVERLATGALRSSGGAKSGVKKFDRAARGVDILQAELGDAVARWAMTAMTMAWSLVFLTLGLITATDRYGFLLAEAATRFDFILATVFLMGSFILAMIVAWLLGLCAGACGLVAFTWLDRLTSAQ